MIVARPEAHRDPRSLADLIRAESVTTMHFVPSMLRAFLQEPTVADCRTLHRVFASGEALPPALCDRFFEVLPGVALDNLYGPTEAAVDVTHWACRAGAAVVPIGRPIDNVRVYVLDERREPVPIGVRGELFIGGVQVGRGYLNRPELTAERFVPDPFDPRPGTRLYRTGDVARWLPSGEVEYLGRTDFQVKIRGFRIELGEIERVIADHPDVRDAVVVAREDRPGDQRLVAYVVRPAPDPECAATSPGEPSSVLSEDLRTACRLRLPEYMVPSAFVVLDAIPLLPNGKVDRKSLPPPAHAPGPTFSTAQGPRRVLEDKLRAMWEDLLGVTGISVHDSFFDVGGHSLLAVQLFARVEAAFGIKLPLAVLFRAPTIVQLGEVLYGKGWTPCWSSLVPIQTTGSRHPLFFAHAIGGNVLNYRLVSKYLGPEQPFYGLQARGLSGDDAPHETVEQMAAAYIHEMRDAQPHGPYQIGGASTGGVLAYEMAQQLRALGEQVSVLVMLDTYRVGPPTARTAQVLAASRFHYLGMRLDYHLGNLLLRTPWEGLKYLADWARHKVPSAPGHVKALTGEGTQTVRQVIASGKRALAKYVPRPYPGNAVMLFSQEEAGQAFYDGRLAWAELLGEGLVVRLVPGSHENMLDEPNVARVAAVLARCLREA